MSYPVSAREQNLLAEFDGAPPAEAPAAEHVEQIEDDVGDQKAAVSEVHTNESGVDQSGLGVEVHEPDELECKKKQQDGDAISATSNKPVKNKASKKKAPRKPANPTQSQLLENSMTRVYSSQELLWLQPDNILRLLRERGLKTGSQSKVNLIAMILKYQAAKEIEKLQPEKAEEILNELRSKSHRKATDPTNCVAEKFAADFFALPVCNETEEMVAGSASTGIDKVLRDMLSSGPTAEDESKM